MPQRIPLAEIESQLPSFVKIVPESYKGKRYHADFIDTEYGQPFRAIVDAVIKCQHGCKARGNAKRSKPYGAPISLEQVKAKLPAYLSIYPDTWKGFRHKARFRDVEYQEDFEAYCFNIIRTGKGYCPSRERDVFRRAVMLPVSEIQTRLDAIYGPGFVSIVPESYEGTGKMAEFVRRDGKTVSCLVDNALKGMLTSTRYESQAWRATILERDQYLCQITGKPGRLEVHHIRSKSSSPELRFDLSNGIALQRALHIEFHSRYGKTHNTPEQLIEYATSKGTDLRDRLIAHGAPNA